MASLERGRVPPALPVSTGYADLDRLLYGGLPPNFSVALTSPACNEKDLLVESFLETGARNGEITFYVTIDPGAAKPLAEEFPSNFHLFVCNPQADAILENLPNVLKLKGVENLTDVSVALTSAMRKLDSSRKGLRRICLGLVSDVLLQHHAVQTRRWLTSLLAELKMTGFTTLAVIDPQMHLSEELHAILGLFEGDINIYEKETDEGLRKFLRIKKMGNSKYLEDELPLSVTRLEMVPKAKPQESKTGLAALDKHRIAVLPFVNMSPDPNDEYFADGITEEIILTVSEISGLRVISRTSVMRYKKTKKAVKEIGRELEVGSILEGSFRKAGNRIRVTTQLINVADDEHLWAQNYDRNLDDIFAVQSDVARQVAEALRVRILTREKERVEKKPTGSMDAYALYLKGRYLCNKRGPENIRKAIECFEPAIKRDPNFALAYVGLADCYLIMVDWGTLSLKEAAPKVKSLLAAALKIDERLAEAHASLASLLEEEWEWSAAEAEYKRTIELNPNYATGHMWYSNLLYDVGRIEEGFQEITVALELDPVSPQANANLGAALLEAGRVKEGVEQFKKTLALEPDFVPAHMRLGETYVMLSKLDEGIVEFRRAEELAPEFAWPKCFIAYASALAGRCEEAKHLLAKLETASEGFRAPPAFIAAVHFALGDHEKAYSLMEKCVEERSHEALYVMKLAFFRKIQRERRFKELFEKAVHGS